MNIPKEIPNILEIKKPARTRRRLRLKSLDNCPDFNISIKVSLTALKLGRDVGGTFPV